MIFTHKKISVAFLTFESVICPFHTVYFHSIFHGRIVDWFAVSISFHAHLLSWIKKVYSSRPTNNLIPLTNKLNFPPKIFLLHVEIKSKNVCYWMLWFDKCLYPKNRCAYLYTNTHVQYIYKVSSLICTTFQIWKLNHLQTSRITVYYCFIDFVHISIYILY